MQSCLGNLHLCYCIIYLDDVTVFSKTPEKHVFRLRAVFEKLIQVGLEFNPSNCEVFRQELTYSGHVVAKDGIQTHPRKVEVICKWPAPTNMMEVRSFLGFTNCYCRFIKKYAQLAKPLYILFSGENASRKHKPFKLHTSASVLGLGAVLYQVHKSVKKVISYASRSLTQSETKYPIHKLEFLGLKWAINEQFHEYLYRNTFYVYTDNNPLTYVLMTAKLDAMGHRWVASLANYNFHLHYQSGRSNVEADALSQINGGKNE